MLGCAFGVKEFPIFYYGLFVLSVAEQFVRSARMIAEIGVIFPFHPYVEGQVMLV